jgi:hypothetical protein
MAPNRSKVAPEGIHDEVEKDEEGEEDDDESKDMLAPAREHDPETITAREDDFEKFTRRGSRSSSSGDTWIARHDWEITL